MPRPKKTTTRTRQRPVRHVSRWYENPFIWYGGKVLVSAAAAYYGGPKVGAAVSAGVSQVPNPDYWMEPEAWPYEEAPGIEDHWVQVPDPELGWNPTLQPEYIPDMDDFHRNDLDLWDAEHAHLAQRFGVS